MRGALGEKRGGKALLAAAYGYLALPFALFAAGWLRWWLAAVVLAVLALCLWLMLRHSPALWAPKMDRAFALKAAAVVAIVVVWVVLAGVGRFAWQNDDHDVRNALFRILVEQPWPVVEQNPPPDLYGGPVAFVYYFGFWLPPALVGKALGLAAGNVAQVVWAALGVTLVYWLALAASLKKMRVWPLVVLVFFSGLDIVGCWLTGSFVNPVTSTLHLERWANPFQFSSFSTQLFWVYNQAVPAWLATLLLYVQKNNRSLVIIMALSAITSTLPVLGMLPVAAFVALRNIKDAHTLKPFPWKRAAKGVFTFENLAGGGLVGMVSLLFLATNNAGQKVGLRAAPTPRNVLIWLVFVVLEVGIYLALVWPRQKKNPLYWVILACFAIFPWVGVGNGGDFGMRATIPPLVILYLMVVDTLADSHARKHKLLFAALVAALCIGGVTAKNEILRPVVMAAELGPGDHTVERHPFATTWSDNFYGDADGFFYRYLMRR